MSFSQFGYPYSTTSPGASCCEPAPRSGPDASSAPAAASLCCAPYESRLLAPGRAELNAALGMYGAPYAAGQGYGNYLPYSAEPAAIYTALVSEGARERPTAVTAPPERPGRRPGSRAGRAGVGSGTPHAAPAGTGRWISPLRPGARIRGCTSTARTRTPPRARRSCWPSSPR
uniref:Iroquois homeobox 4 n=1 Tax=Phasianus colchicus TaxID=9054 RepID=A0A669QYB0_PHACC